MKPAEPVAVLGLGCRFPGAEGVEAYWDLLCRGGDAVREVPSDRWDSEAIHCQQVPPRPGHTYCRWGGFLEQGDWFDAELFGIDEHEAERMDPQQGLILEVAWQALEHAGIPPDSLVDTETGVFLGISTKDFDRRIANQWSILDVRASTGSCGSIAANRLSYTLGLCGPSLSIDVACASSLVAVHLACQSLWAGECDLALAGGAHLLLSPANMIGLSQGMILARDGRCKSFSSDADGYVYGEGCGIVVLKRLDRALKDGDPIWAVIRGTAVNHNGPSNGLSAPFRPAQENVVRRALEMGGVLPASIAYVEAHGAGTLVGDAIEVKALKSVLSQQRLPEHTCLIGAVKPNLGHLAAAAGVSSLLKAILSVRYARIPKTLHTESLSKHLQLDDTFRVARQEQAWPEYNAPRRAGVSSFAFGGANAHVVLEQPPPISLTDLERPNCSFSLVLPISARSRSALEALARNYIAHLRGLAREQNAPAAFVDTCFTAALGRAHLRHRLAVVADSSDAAISALESFLDQDQSASIAGGELRPRNRKELLYSYAAGGFSTQLHGLPPGWQARWMLLKQEAGERLHATLPVELVPWTESLIEMLAITLLLDLLGICPRYVYGSDAAGAWLARMIAENGWNPSLCPEKHNGRSRKPQLLVQLRELESADLRRYDPDKTTIFEIGSRDAEFSSLARFVATGYITGNGPDWRAFFDQTPCRRRTVPTYPFERRRYWEIPAETKPNHKTLNQPAHSSE